MLRQKGDFAAALEADRTSLALRRKAGRPEEADDANPLSGMGKDLLMLGRPAEAIAPLERAEALRATLEAQPPVAETRFMLARALWEGGGDKRRARALAEQARQDVLPEATRFGGSLRTGLDAIDEWLATHRAP
jgi:hypothetical protein